MDIDMTALRLLEREKEISLDVLVGAIEQALLSAYHHTPGAKTHARVEVDRRSGHVTVWARDPESDAEYGRHALEGFGRMATATARQVLMQRLREAGTTDPRGVLRTGG